MIWFKRFIPFVIIIAVWFGYQEYNVWSTEKVATQDEIMAEATARIWVAAGELRNEPDRYLEYRDSVLRANRLTAEQMRKLIDRCESDPTGLFPFTQAVYDLVDSLSRVSDSISRVADSLEEVRVADSLASLDSVDISDTLR